MKRIITQGIVLSRTNFGEADRILTVLTPDHGKLRLMAKGVRKSTSKLAGGIELFCVSEISFMAGRGEIGTLVSTQLLRYFSIVVTDINRTMLGYELIKRLNRVTEDQAGQEYFDLLLSTFDGLNCPELDTSLLQLWFEARLLKLAGYQPSLLRDSAGHKLLESVSYDFDYDTQQFNIRDGGSVDSSTIKLLRLLFASDNPLFLVKVRGTNKAVPICGQVIRGLNAQFMVT